MSEGDFERRLNRFIDDKAFTKELKASDLEGLGIDALGDISVPHIRFLQLELSQMLLSFFEVNKELRGFLDNVPNSDSWTDVLHWMKTFEHVKIRHNEVSDRVGQRINMLKKIAELQHKVATKKMEQDRS